MLVLHSLAMSTFGENRRVSDPRLPIPAVTPATPCPESENCLVFNFSEIPPTSWTSLSYYGEHNEDRLPSPSSPRQGFLGAGLLALSEVWRTSFVSPWARVRRASSSALSTMTTFPQVLERKRNSDDKVTRKTEFIDKKDRELRKKFSRTRSPYARCVSFVTLIIVCALIGGLFSGYRYFARSIEGVHSCNVNNLNGRFNV